MSVVAVKVFPKKIVIGSDSIRVTYWTQEKDKYAKLWEVNNMVLGTSGKCEEGFLMQQYLMTRQPESASEERVLEFLSEAHAWIKKKVNKADYVLKNSYFLVYKNKVFYFHEYFIREVKDFYAIGAGMDYALAVLHTKGTVKEALEVACELSIFCEKPLNIIEINKKDGTILRRT